MKEQIAARLKQAREKHFKRAVDAAKSLGVQYPTYAGHENANRTFDVETAALYARRFKVSLDWLITGQGRGPDGRETPITSEEEIRSFLARIEGLSDYDIDLALAVIRNALAAQRAGQAPSADRDQQSPASRRREPTPSS